MKAFLTALFALPLILGGCAGFQNDLSESYGMLKRSINGVIETPPDPVKEEKKKLPVYDGTCPPVSARPDLVHLVEFHDPRSTSDALKVSEVTITGVSNTCRVENQSLLMQVDISLSGKTGPKARWKPGDQPNFAYPYFIAVTDANGNVVSKEIFAASVSYGRSQNETTQTETIFQSMPFPDASIGRMFNVIVGFQLTPEQLAYNQRLFGSVTPASYAPGNLPPVPGGQGAAQSPYRNGAAAPYAVQPLSYPPAP